MTYGIDRVIQFVKESKMALPVPEDMDFCSSEEYYENEIHSPTDSSEDSVEVKICPIQSKNKRKCAEPRKVHDPIFSGPLKKRMCLKVKSEANESHPFRPWSPTKPLKTEEDTKPLFSSANNFVVPSSSFNPPISSYFRPPSPAKFYPQTEPVSLVKKKECSSSSSPEVQPPAVVTVKTEIEESPRVPIHPQIATLSAIETERMILNSTETFPALQQQAGGSNSSRKSESARREQRNYKNMTRERRIEANARERTRVHTISAAFDTLRKSIPSYSNVQKLSKLSVLRIACSYIMTLANIVDENDESTAECVDLVSRTIQREGKLRKKKDDND